MMHIGKTAATRKRHLSRQFSSLVPNIKSPMDATRSHVTVAVSNMYGDQVKSSVAGRVLQAERVKYYGDSVEAFQKVQRIVSLILPYNFN